MSGRILPPLALVTAVVAGLASAADRPPIVTVARPLERDTADYDFVGRLDPSQETEVRAPVGGTVEKVAVHPGDEVKAGQVLVELDTGPLREALKRSEAVVKEHEAGLKRRQELLDRARNLARTVKKDELTKRADSRLPDLRTAMEKVLKLAEGETKNDPFELRQEGLRRLRDALDRQLRLARTRKKEGCDLLFEGNLLDLRRTIEATNRLPAAGGDAAKHKAFDEELRKLHGAIDDLLVVSRARSDKGIDVLAAEAELTARRLEGARADAEAARHEVEAANVTAPVAGYISRVGVKPPEGVVVGMPLPGVGARVGAAAVQPGDRVAAGTRAATLLCTIARIDTVRLSFDMDEGTLLRLQKLVRDGKANGGEVVGFPVRLSLGSHPVTTAGTFGLLASPLGQGPMLAASAFLPHVGKIEFIDSRVGPRGRPADVRPGDRLVHVRATFANPGGALTAEALAPKKLWRVDVRLTIGEPRHVLLVAPAAVTVDADGKPVVLVIRDKNVVESRPVTLGALHEGLQVIEDGLKPGDRVILGSERVKRRPDDPALTPDDFARDLRLLGVRPGIVVAPVEAPMPTRVKLQRRARD
jgi:multidrug efflux pump subunit AcrA (membrane-fusion protein)